MASDIISPGRVAVVTGAAMGIGAAAVRRFAREGMRLCLFDQDKEALERFAATLNAEKELIIGDVTSTDDLTRLLNTVYGRFGEVALLMNNAGIAAGPGPWGDIGGWRRQLEVNLFSIVAAQGLFVPRMLTQQGTAAVVNLGSKEGITTPPGNAAYSVAKAGVKVLTEQLAHELRTKASTKVNAHLLVPSYTWTPMNFPGMDEQAGKKPEEPWTADQVIDLFVERFAKGDFYILCPDNAVTPQVDAKRIRWACEDINQNRPALSRWHPDWKGRFAEWMSKA